MKVNNRTKAQQATSANADKKMDNRLQESEEAVLNIAKGISATTGKEFFSSLIEHLATMLKADYAYIAELLPDNPGSAKTLSLIAGNQMIDNIEVDLAGTPCEKVLEKETCAFPSDIPEKFPKAHMMAQMGVQGYIGTTLFSSSGKGIGLMSAMFKKPVKNTSLVKSLLQIFAARASAELERRHSEKALQNAHVELEMRVKERTYELEAAVKLLEKEINSHKVTEQSLRDNELRFRAVADSTSDLLWDGNVNDNTLQWFGDIDGMLGYGPGEFPRTIEGHLEHIHPDDRKSVIKSIKKAVESGKDFNSEYRILCKDGTCRYWDERGKAIGFQEGKPVRWVGAVSDITERKKTEEELLSAEKELKSHANELIESNAALKVLLKQREQDKLDFENNIMSNIKHLIMPYIEKLKTNGLEKDGLAYLSIIESNMKEIVSPFATKLSFQFLDFTPREIMIADLIKDGKHDKDIMEILNISLDTVKTHRKNIRKKLDIYGKRINLRTKLLSLIK
ncbi:MAG: PAS domain-containing protein [Nitrospirota bacterium]